MRTSPSILVKICVSSLPEDNGLTSLCLFLLLYLLNQLLWVQTHSSSVPCKQPTIQLQTQGTDPCAVYREKQVEYILNHVESGHKKCKVCNKELSSTQKLKSHIRVTHCHSTAYKCSTCSKPFGDPYALSVHQRVHPALARKHICAYGGNAYLSKSKLTDHEKKHTIGHLTCHHCYKSFAEKKGLVDHLKICKKVPSYDQRLEEELWPYKCPDCFRHYAHRWDVLKHQCTSHPKK